MVYFERSLILAASSCKMLSKEFRRWNEFVEMNVVLACSNFLVPEEALEAKSFCIWRKTHLEAVWRRSSSSRSFLQRKLFCLCWLNNATLKNKSWSSIILKPKWKQNSYQVGYLLQSIVSLLFVNGNWRVTLNIKSEGWKNYFCFLLVENVGKKKIQNFKFSQERLMNKSSENFQHGWLFPF